MKIITLGTSHGDSTLTRFNSSTLYETGGTLYLVDVGAPAEALLKRQGYSCGDIRAAFITHMHDDHAGGLTGLLKQITKYGQGRRFKFSLFLPEEKAISALQNWFSALHEEASSPLLEYNAVNDGQIYEDENLSVSAIRTAHLRTLGRTKGEPCSFAYVLHFKKENKTVLHSGDLCADFSDFPKISTEKYFDVCLCEATHYQPESAAPILNSAKFGRLIFIHIANCWHDCIPGAFGEKALLSHSNSYPYPVEIAHAGDVFSL